MIHEYDVMKTFYEVENGEAFKVNDSVESSEASQNLQNELNQKEKELTQVSEKLRIAQTTIEDLRSQIVSFGGDVTAVDFGKRCLFDEMRNI